MRVGHGYLLKYVAPAPVTVKDIKDAKYIEGRIEMNIPYGTSVSRWGNPLVPIRQTHGKPTPPHSDLYLGTLAPSTDIRHSPHFSSNINTTTTYKSPLHSIRLQKLYVNWTMLFEFLDTFYVPIASRPLPFPLL